MNTIQPLLQGRANDYLLVLPVSEELCLKISQLKNELAEKYRLKTRSTIKTHIVLVRFTQWESMEEKFIQRMQSISMGIMPFKIELQDFGYFPSHTIYINVISKMRIQNLTKDLKEFQKLIRMSKDIKPHFIDEPFVMLATKLKAEQFESVSLEFGNRSFAGRFISNYMLLLKRKAQTKDAFQIVRRFDFLNLPVITKQGNLFNLQN